MTADTFSTQMQNLISSLKHIAVSIKSLISASRDFSKRNLDVQKCSVCVANFVAAMTTSLTSPSLAAKG